MLKDNKSVLCRVVCGTGTGTRTRTGKLGNWDECGKLGLGLGGELETN